jgi:hypothetical protein
MTTLEAVTKPGSHVYIATPDLAHRTVPHNIAEWDVVYPSPPGGLRTRIHLPHLDRTLPAFKGKGLIPAESWSGW